VHNYLSRFKFFIESAMVPVEPISLTIIEYFEYLKAAESHIEIILVKLDLEKTRLLIWGNFVGLLKDVSDKVTLGLDDPIKVKSISGYLKCIKTLLSDANKLRNEYGLQAVQETKLKVSKDIDYLSSNSMNIFKFLFKHFWAWKSASQNKVGVISKTEWAIHNKASFEGLIVYLRDFTDGLYQVILPSRDYQDRIVQDDIASLLDLTKLAMVKEACEEASYRAWSEMASVVIEESAKGTIDRRSFEERMKDAKDGNVLVDNGKENESCMVVSLKFDAINLTRCF